MVARHARLVCVFVILSSIPAHGQSRGGTNRDDFSADHVMRLRPPKRVTEILRMLDERGLREADRQQLVTIFARDALALSRHYGNNSPKIRPNRWIEVLSEGARLDPDNPTIALALTKLFINEQRYEDAIAACISSHERNPTHESRAWIAHAKSHLAADEGPKLEKPTIDVHFCVITKNRKARKKASLPQLREEVDILNRRFVTSTGEPIVKFRFKSATMYEEIRGVDDAFRKLGDSRVPYDSNAYAKHFNACGNTRIRDPHAINFYVYDSYSKRRGYDDDTCHGKRNSNRPYVLIDWERLGDMRQSPEVHEMGHAFGLGHVSVIGATRRTKTNIMCSTEAGFGSGGDRSIGFTEAQAALVRHHAERTLKRLR